MAYYSAEDITAFTYNSQDLKAFINGDVEIADEAVKTEWRAFGADYMSRKLTGQYNCPPITAPFVYDGTATGPGVICARGTSATLTVTLASNISFTGTFIVTNWAFGIPQEGLDTIVVTLESDGDVTWDLNAAS